MRCSRVVSSAETLESSATDGACSVAVAAMNHCHPCVGLEVGYLRRARVGAASWVWIKQSLALVRQAPTTVVRYVSVSTSESACLVSPCSICCPCNLPGGSTQTQRSHFASGAFTFASNCFGCFDSRRVSSILRIRFETRTT